MTWTRWRNGSGDWTPWKKSDVATIVHAYWYHRIDFEARQSLFVDDMRLLDLTGNLDAPLP